MAVNTRTNRPSNQRPGDDIVTAVKPAIDFAQPASQEEEKDSLSSYMLLTMLSQQNAYERSAEIQAEIDAAFKEYQPEIEALDAEDREAMIRDREEHPENYDDNPNNDTGTPLFDSRGARVPSDGSPTVTFRDSAPIAIGERQNRVNDVIADAARSTGVNLQIMQGIWHVETKFSSIREVSSTGCSGPFQFTRGTWAEMILKHGDEIAERLRAQGHNEDADIALRLHTQLRNREIRPSNEQLQQQRFNGHIATYAAAHYIKDIADRNGINEMDPRSGGMLYAAYNVGEGSLRKLMRLGDSDQAASSVLGRVAQLNPMFYRGGASASEALANYQAAMDNGVRQYARNFGGDASPRTEVASNQREERSAPRASARNEDHGSSRSLAHTFREEAERITAPASRVVSDVANSIGEAGRSVLNRGRQMFASLDLNPFS